MVNPYKTRGVIDNNFPFLTIPYSLQCHVLMEPKWLHSETIWKKSSTLLIEPFFP